jgi:glycosyltransferase 2 family protein
VKRWGTRLLPFAVTGLLLALLLRQVSLPELADELERAQPGWLVVGVALYVLVNYLRAVRFRAVLPGYAGRSAALMPISFATAFLNNTLPMRSGEVSFVLLARASHDIPAAEATAALAVARLFDYLAVAVLFVPLVGLALPQLPPTTDWPVPGVPTAWLVGGAGLLVLVGAVVALSLASLGGRAVAAARWALARLGWIERRWAQKVLAFGDRTVAALAGLRTRHTYGRALGVSLLLWLVMFLWTYSFTRALGIEESLGLFIVGASFGVFAKSIPLPDVGGTGLAVTAWTLGFILIGWPKEQAIASGLAVAAMTLAMSAAFELASLWWLKRQRPAGAADGEAR